MSIDISPKTPVLDNKVYWLDARLTITTFCMIVSLVFWAIYMATRAGVDTDFLPITRILIITFFVLLAPLGYHTLYRVLGWKHAETWLNSDGIIVLGALMLLAFAGKLTPIIGFSLYPLFGALGIVLLINFLIQILRFKSILWHIKLLITGLIVGLFLASAVWGFKPHGATYLNPLFMESSVVAPYGLDTIFHINIANVMLTYNHASTGLHGIPYISYHYGSHWLFGALSQVTEVSVLEFYQMLPLLFYPLFLYVMALFGCRLRLRLSAPTRLLSDERWFFTAWTLMLISVFPYQMQLSLGILWDRYVSSESYFLALLLLFITLDCIVAVISRLNLSTQKIGRTEIIAILFIIPILAVILGFTKISVLFVFMCAYGYAFIKMRLYRSPIVLIGFMVAVILAYWTYRTTGVGGNFATVESLSFIKNYVGLPNILFWLLTYLFFTIVYVSFRVYELKIRTLGDLWVAIASHRMIDAELLVIVAFGGALPGMFINIPWAGAGFFSDVQYWVASGMLLALIPHIGTTFFSHNRTSLRRVWRLRYVGMTQAGLGILSLFLFMILVNNYAIIFTNLLRLNLQIYDALIDNHPSLSSKNLQDVISNGRYAQSDIFKQLASLPLKEKAQTLLYIPKDNLFYWGGDCLFDTYMAPAVTGIAMVEGMPIDTCEGFNEYVLSAYINTGWSNPTHLADPELCQTVQGLGFYRVIRLDITATHHIQATQIECSPTIIDGEYPSTIIASSPMLLFLFDVGNLFFDFSEEDENRSIFETQGFHEFESDSNTTVGWTSTPTASVMFSYIPDGHFDTQQTYRITVSVFASSSESVLQSLQMNINDMPIDTFERIDDTRFVGELDGSMLNQPSLNLIFQTDRITFPYDFGIEDERLLGIALDSVQIEPMP